MRETWREATLKDFVARQRRRDVSSRSTGCWDMSIFRCFFEMFGRYADHYYLEAILRDKTNNTSADFCAFCGKNKRAAEDAEMPGMDAGFAESAELETQIEANLEGLGL